MKTSLFLQLYTYLQYAFLPEVETRVSFAILM